MRGKKVLFVITNDFPSVAIVQTALREKGTNMRVSHNNPLFIPKQSYVRTSLEVHCGAILHPCGQKMYLTMQLLSVKYQYTIPVVLTTVLTCFKVYLYSFCSKKKIALIFQRRCSVIFYMKSQCWELTFKLSQHASSDILVPCFLSKHDF